jgi:hypothetical protein
LSSNGGIGFVNSAIWPDGGEKIGDECVCARPWTPEGPLAHKRTFEPFQQ